MENVVNIGGFHPHGMCLLWKWYLLVPYIVSSLIIAFSFCCVIPVQLFRFAKFLRNVGRDELYSICDLLHVSGEVRGAIFVASMTYIAFIAICGVGHAFDVWVVWQPDYKFHVFLRVIMAGSALVAIWYANGTGRAVKRFLSEIEKRNEEYK
jgi:magnesium-transporting ATPase (P-type)